MAHQQRVHAVVQAVSDASYVFTTTKPSAKASLLKRVTVGLPTAEKVKALKGAFTTATALAQGVALAKESGNRPANHATPTMLARAAQGLAKKSRIKCQVLGPKEVEKLGMGSFARWPKVQASHYALLFCITQVLQKRSHQLCSSAKELPLTQAVFHSNQALAWMR
jgi:leucyl aminopeptidase